MIIRLADAEGQMMDEVKLSETAPPTFLVHTDDDKSTSLGAVGIYTRLMRAGVSAELHVYARGGHGYGTRDRDGSVIGTWSDRAVEWLKVIGVGG